MQHLDGNLVYDREGAETLAKCFEQRQWHKTRQTPPKDNIPSSQLLELNQNIRTDDFDIQEMEQAMNSLNNNKAPGQNRITAELIQAPDETSKYQLLKLLNKCYRDKTLFKEMNNADLAILYKKGATDKPENYRPIALLNLSYKILAKMIQVRLCKGFDEHLDSQQYGFRKAKSTSQPLFIYRMIFEIREEAGLEMYTLLLGWEKHSIKWTRKE